LVKRDRHAISEFRRRHFAAFEKLFVEVLKLASTSGLLKVGRLAFDGMKIKANASRHALYSNRAMSYERMPTDEVRLQNEIRELLAQAEAEDQAEDAQYGVNRRGARDSTSQEPDQEQLRRTGTPARRTRSDGQECPSYIVIAEGDVFVARFYVALRSLTRFMANWW
jgi:hypothetical protein